MKWYFREDDLARDDPPGIVLIFRAMKPLLVYDPVTETWRMKEHVKWPAIA